MSLGEETLAGKENEIVAIPRLLDLIYIKNCIITFYINSLPAEARLLNNSIKTHWVIENNLHWNLDVIFKEDHQELRSQSRSPKLK